MGRVVIDRVAEQLPEGSTIGNVSLSWLRPALVSDVAIRDEAGRELSVKEIESGQSLLWMLLKRSAPTSLTLRGIDVVIDLSAEQPLSLPNVSNSSSQQESSSNVAIPSITVEDLHAVVKNGPFARPVDLTVDELVTAPKAGESTFRIRGTGHIFDGEFAAPMTLEGEAASNGQQGRYGIIVDNLSTGVLTASILNSPVASEGLLNLKAVVSHSSLEKWDWKVAATSNVVHIKASFPDAPLVTLKEVTAKIGGDFDSQTKSYQLAPIALDSDLVTAELTGSGKVTDATEISLEGRIAMSGRAVAIAGLPPEISLQSAVFDPIQFHTANSEVQIAGSLRWPNANAFGLTSENGHVRYRLDKDTLAIELTSVPIGSGRALGNYVVRLNNDIPVLQAAGGPALQNIALSEALCRRWIHYVSPLMANATDVRGHFDLEVDAFETPLATDRPLPISTGRLIIREASMKPGPMGRELLGSIGDITALAGNGNLSAKLGGAADKELVQLPPQTVAFAIRDQSVLHRGFTAQAGKVTVTTEGAVGFNDQLNMVAQIQVDPSAIGDRPILAGIFGRPIAIPIRGTVESPQLDRRALQNVGTDAAAGAINGLLDGLINRKKNRR